MYRIAICDEDRLTSGSIEQMIEEYAQRISLRIIIDVFANAEELYEKLKEGTHYDTIFLEIYLKPINGIKLGTRIRRELNNNVVNIIFVTTLSNKVLDIFEAEPQDLIIKPVARERINNVLRRMISKYERFPGSIFTYSVVGTTYRIPALEIIYFRVTERTIYIKTVHKEDWFYGALKTIRQRVNNDDFFMANRNYLINTNHIISYNNRELYMTNNEKIMLGIKNSKEFFELQK